MNVNVTVQPPVLRQATVDLTEVPVATAVVLLALVGKVSFPVPLGIMDLHTKLERALSDAGLPYRTLPVRTKRGTSVSTIDGKALIREVSEFLERNRLAPLPPTL